MSDWKEKREKLKAEQESKKSSKKKDGTESSGGYAKPSSVPAFGQVSQAEEMAQMREQVAKQKAAEKKAAEEAAKAAEEAAKQKAAEEAAKTEKPEEKVAEEPKAPAEEPKPPCEKPDSIPEEKVAVEGNEPKSSPEEAQPQGSTDGATTQDAAQGDGDVSAKPEAKTEDQTERWQNMNPFLKKSLVIGGALSKIASDAIREALSRSKEYVGKAGAYVCAQVVDQINTQADFIKSLWIRPVARSKNPLDREAVIVLAVTTPVKDMQEKMILALQAVIINPLVDKKLVSEFKMVSSPPAGFEDYEGTLLILQIAVPVTPSWCPITYTDLKAWKKALGKTVELQVVLPPGAEGAENGGAAKVDEDDEPPEPMKRGDIKWKDVLWPF